MEAITSTLNNYGILAVKLLQDKVRPLSATGKTEDSPYYDVSSDEDSDTLTIFAREFFTTIESGRGPRKSSAPGGFQDSMLEYMRARGIGNDLTEKKRKQLARFLTYRINKYGDKTFQQGGRQVYSVALEKLIDDLKVALRKDFITTFRATIKNSFHAVST